MAPIEADFWAELSQIQAESIGWIRLDEGAYLHLVSDESLRHHCHRDRRHPQTRDARLKRSLVVLSIKF